jgi:hypothetical protein
MRKRVRHREFSLEGVLPEIEELVSGQTRTVFVPKSDRFFGQLWKTMLPALGAHVSETKANTFRLSPDFFQRFVPNLYLVPMYKRNAKSKYYETSDWVAQALCDTATELLERCDRDNETVWPAGRPVSEAWEPLKPLIPALWPNEDIYEYAPGQGFKPPRSNRHEHLRIGVSVELSPDSNKQDLPELKITVKGKPIFDLIRPTQIAVESPEWPSSVKEAKLMWKSLLHLLLVRLGIERAERGRPRGDLGSRAAWLKDQLGLSWRQISKRLGQPQENCRKQAKQFWKRERAKYATMVSSAAR